MPSRKMNAVLDPPVIDGEIVQPTIVPPADAAPRKRGRPSNASKAERAAQVAQVAAADKLDPKDTVILAAMVLRGVGLALKADAPTDEEIAMVNGPLCLVANKYSLGGRFVPELMLAGSMMMVVASMKQRRIAQVVAAGTAPVVTRPAGVVNLDAGTVKNETGDPHRPGPQGFGQDAIDPAVSSLAAALTRD